ncbi:HEXXH motif-containing putative peptide modification protein [Streptomyces sp. NPDC057376]|uniref:aKG-HExxH-type peptide beta-hydroxylase n=1 Tax=unclassified Streptomyces TaxID=2593676 RepID=UPI000ACF390E|nr:HEXXH motif-containing putative peptide modification protein [Streptomyces sp. CB02414]
MTSEPRPAPFRVPDRLFAELAAGGGSTEAVAFLERGERARRLLLLRTLLDRLAPLPTPLTPVAEAWEVFKLAAGRAPEAVDGLLLAPTTGGWIAHMLRRVHGTATGPPLWAEAGRLNVLAVTAALHAGAETELTVPLVDGGLHLPGLGLLRLPDAPPGPTVARATTTRTGELTLTGPLDHGPRPSVTCHPRTAPAKTPPTSPPAGPDIADGASRACPPAPSTGSGGSRGFSGVGPSGAAPDGPEDPGGLRVAGSSVPPPVEGGTPAARPTEPSPAGPDGPQDSSRTRPTAPASTTEGSSTSTTPSASGAAPSVSGAAPSAFGTAPSVSGVTSPAFGTASSASGTASSVSGAAPSVSGAAPSAFGTAPSVSGVTSPASGTTPSVSGATSPASGTASSASGTAPSASKAASSVSVVTSPAVGTASSATATTPPATETDPWLPLRTLTHPTPAGPVAIPLDDLDPYRDLDDPVPPARLDAEEAAEWQRVFDDAVAILAASGTAQGPGRLDPALIRAVVPYGRTAATPPAAPTVAVSASSGDSFGAMLISRPGSALALAETLVHEFQHSKLAALLHLFPLLDDDRAERYYAPWRADPRHLTGLLHGAYAFTGVAGFWRDRLAEPAHAEAAAYHFALRRLQSRLVVRTLLSSARLTAPGRRLVTGLARTLDGWLREPVDPAALSRARTAAALHRTQWRLRNVAAAPAGPDGTLRFRPDRGFWPDTRTHAFATRPAVPRTSDEHLAAGDPATALDGYAKDLARDPADPHARSGWIVARALLDPGPGTRHALARPELLRPAGP